MKYLLYILGFITFSGTCAQDKSLLIGCWTDSREENVGDTDISIYRPCEYKEFPPSRFRFTMELRENNECSWLYLAPNDAHHMKEGTWMYEEKDATLVIFDENQNEIKRFKIEFLDEDILKVIEERF